MVSMVIQTFTAGWPLHICGVIIYLLYLLIRRKNFRIYLEPLAVAVMLLALSTLFSATIYSPEMMEYMSIRNLALSRINCDFISFYNNIFVPGFIGDFHALINWLGNILLFVPLGGCLMWLMKGERNRVKWIVLSCSILSVLIETVQMSYGRIADVIDVMLNTSGSYIGCFIVIYILALTDNCNGKYI